MVASTDRAYIIAEGKRKENNINQRYKITRLAAGAYLIHLFLIPSNLLEFLKRKEGREK